MLRGFRWQFLVLLMALSLFGVAFISRITPVPDAVQTPTVMSPTSPPATPSPGAIGATPLPPTPDSTPVQVVSTSELPTYREALIGTIQRLNPLFADLNPVDRDITALIFEGLTRPNRYGEPAPALAKSWVISSDGLEYVVQLRDDVLWQDGIAFTAVDVIYTVSLLQSPDFPGNAALGAFWRTVEIQQLGDHLVRFRLTQPLGSFLDALCIGMLPEHALRGTTAKQLATHPFNLTPIGTGPYQLEALRASPDGKMQMVDLRVAPVYRQRPAGRGGFTIERVRFRLFDTFDVALGALKAAAVDGLAARSRAERAVLLTVANVKLNTSIEPTAGILIFNWASDKTRFFREQRVRQALLTGLNRSSIVERYLFDSAVRADSPIFPGSWAYTAELPWPRPDPNAARQLLETARIPPGKAEATAEPTGAPRLSFSVLTPDDSRLVSVAQEVAAQWAQLNLTVTVESADVKTYQERLDKGAFDVALVELSLGNSADPDVYHFWDQGQYPDGPNYGGVDDRRIAEDLERARRDSSGINRAIRYRDFQQDFISRAIAIPLYYPLFTYATSSRVSGVQLGFVGSPASRFYTIQDWEIK